MSVTAKKLAKAQFCQGATSFLDDESRYYSGRSVVVDLDDYSVILQVGYNNAVTYDAFNTWDQYLMSTLVQNNATGEVKEYTPPEIIGGMYQPQYEQGEQIAAFPLANNKFVIFVNMTVGATSQTIFGRVYTVNADLTLTKGSIYTLYTHVPLNNTLASGAGKIVYAPQKIGNLYAFPILQLTFVSSSAFTPVNSIGYFTITGDVIAQVNTLSLPAQASQTTSGSNGNGKRHLLTINDTQAMLFVYEFNSSASILYAAYKITASGTALSFTTIYASSTTAPSTLFPGYMLLFGNASAYPWITHAKYFNGVCLFGASSDWYKFDPITNDILRLATPINISGPLSPSQGSASISLIDSTPVICSGFGVLLASNGQLIQQRLLKAINCLPLANAPVGNGYGSSAHKICFIAGGRAWIIDKHEIEGDVSLTYSKYTSVPIQFSGGVLCCLDYYCTPEYGTEVTLITGAIDKTYEVGAIFVSSKYHGSNNTLVLRDSEGDICTIKLSEVKDGCINLANHPIVIEYEDVLKAVMLEGFGDVSLTLYGIVEEFGV